MAEAFDDMSCGAEAGEGKPRSSVPLPKAYINETATLSDIFAIKNGGETVIAGSVDDSEIRHGKFHVFCYIQKGTGLQYGEYVVRIDLGGRASVTDNKGKEVSPADEIKVCELMQVYATKTYGAKA